MIPKDYESIIILLSSFLLVITIFSCKRQYNKESMSTRAQDIDNRLNILNSKLDKLYGHVEKQKKEDEAKEQEKKKDELSREMQDYLDEMNKKRYSTDLGDIRVVRDLTGCSAPLGM